MCKIKSIFLLIFMLWSNFGLSLVRAAENTPPNFFINEIAWMGTVESANNEWIEIRSASSSDVDLTGWTLKAADGQPEIALSGVILAGGYFLLERTDDNTLPGVQADIIYNGSLSNSGEILELRDESGNLIDRVDMSGGWTQGDNASKKTMERTNDGGWQTSANAGGTPRAENSVGTVAVQTDSISENNQNSSSSSTSSTPSNPSSSSSNNSAINSPSNEITPTPSAIGGVSPGEVVINEFVSDPGDGKFEWIELFNNKTESVDLSGWSLEDGSKAKTNLSGTIGTAGDARFFVIEKPKGNLNNAGDLIILRDPSGKIIDQVSYGNWDDGYKNDNAPVAADPKSTARKVDGSNTFINAVDFIVTSSPTKGKPNFITSEIKSSSSAEKIATSSVVVKNQAVVSTSSPITLAEAQPQVLLNEILPNPAGDDSAEFVELYNAGDSKINLCQWSLDDEEGGSKPYRFGENVWIAPLDYLVVNRDESGIALNNDKDSARLFDSTGKIVDQVDYIKAGDGMAYVLYDGKWQWSKKATPGLKNQVSIAIVKPAARDAGSRSGMTNKKSTSKSKNILSKTKVAAKILNNENFASIQAGDRIRVRGIVAVPPGIFGSQYFYLAGEPGIQVYSNKKKFPEMKVGDEMEVAGEISLVNGEKRLKTKTQSDFKKIGRRNLPAPLIVKGDELDETSYAELVTVSGTITSKTGSTVMLDDGTEEIAVYVKQATGIKTGAWKVGDQLQIIGIVSGSKSGPRVQPRNQQDVVLNNKTADDGLVLGETTSSTEWALEPVKINWIKYIMIVSFVGAVGSGWFVFKKK